MPPAFRILAGVTGQDEVPVATHDKTVQLPRPALLTSVTVAPLASPGPLLVNVTVYVTNCPAVAVVIASVLVTLRLAAF